MARGTQCFRGIALALLVAVVCLSSLATGWTIGQELYITEFGYEPIPEITPVETYRQPTTTPTPDLLFLPISAESPPLWFVGCHHLVLWGPRMSKLESGAWAYRATLDHQTYQTCNGPFDEVAGGYHGGN